MHLKIAEAERMKLLGLLLSKKITFSEYKTSLLKPCKSGHAVVGKRDVEEVQVSESGEGTVGLANKNYTNFNRRPYMTPIQRYGRALILTSELTTISCTKYQPTLEGEGYFYRLKLILKLNKTR